MTIKHFYTLFTGQRRNALLEVKLKRNVVLNSDVYSPYGVDSFDKNELCNTDAHAICKFNVIFIYCS